MAGRRRPGDAPRPKEKTGAKTRARRSRTGSFPQEWADRLCRRLVNSTHPKQRAAVEDPSHYISFLCARGAGKTTAEIVRMLIKMIRIPRARCVYIATTRVAARELVWDDLKDIVERLGLGEVTGESSFGEVRLTLTLKRNGSTLRLVGADDEREIDKLRGKSYHEVGIDEAASHSPKLLERLIERVIGPRLGNTGGVIALFGTPGHFLSGLFYDVTRPGSPMHRPFADRNNPDVADALWSSHGWNLLDGAPHVPALQQLWDRALEDKRRRGWSDKHPVWLREYCGLWAADDSTNIYDFREYLVGEDGVATNVMWNIWDPERVGPMRIAKLPEGHREWLYSFGADLGSSDPFALQVFAGSPTDTTRTLYHVFEFESGAHAKMYAKRIAELLFGPDDSKATGAPWPNVKKPAGLIGALAWPVGSVADMTHIGDTLLEELADIYGFRFAAAPHAFGEKYAAIELFNGDLHDGRIKVMKGSKLAEQLGSLQWIADEFGKVKENKAQANHSSDAGLMARGPLVTMFESYGTPAAATTPAGSALAAGVPRQRPVDVVPDQAPSNEVDAFGGDFGDDAWGNG